MSATHPAYLWWNGEQVAWEDATVHVTAIGWSSVSAIFEGIKAYWNDEREELYVFRLDAHLERFLRSQKLMRMEREYSVAQLSDAIVALLRANECRYDTYIFPLAFASGAGFRALSQSGGAKTSITITTRPSPSHLLKGEVKTACVSSWTRISDNVMPPRVKNISNYRNSQLASAEAAYNGYDTPILLNTQGKVAEGPGSCLMVVRDGQLITPGVTDSILESITRSSLLELARDLGLEAVERTIDRTELYIADEVFMCGTSAEITPIGMVDHYTIGDGGEGPITTRLERAFHDAVRGKDERYARWVTPVGAAKAVPAD
ncbi:MAG TPA: branched-chain amino acid transaminase [Thermomicrobiales bacterium]|nr:branched-chain amino acid transaminase [Thermomicrobiales bacterium]